MSTDYTPISRSALLPLPDRTGSSEIAWPRADTAVGRTWKRVGEPGSREVITAPVAQNEEEQVFNRLVALKVLTSGLAMHLERIWRAGLFRSLDNLLDVEDWDFSDDLPTVESFRTFLRMV